MANSKVITKNDLLKIFEKIQSKFPLKQDTGWHNAELSSSFALYGSTSVVKYRRVGNTVTIEGEVKPTVNITGTDSPYRIFTLPEGYRPDFRQDIICQGSGNSTWLLTVMPEGDVNFARYRDCSLTTGTSFQTITPSHWLPFTITYLVDECSNQSDAFFIANGKVQEKLVSGVNIKSINGESLLGNGNMIISGGGGGGGSTDQLLDMFYPVGSYYETSKSTSEFNPNIAWGGTWELESGGRVHVGAGANEANTTNNWGSYAANTNTWVVGEKGGETRHLLYANESGFPGASGYSDYQLGTHSHNLTSGAGAYFIGITPGANIVINGKKRAYAAENSSGTYWVHCGSAAGLGEYSATAQSGSLSHRHSTSLASANAASSHNNIQPYVVVNRWHRVA